MSEQLGRFGIAEKIASLSEVKWRRPQIFRSQKFRRKFAKTSSEKKVLANNKQE